MAYPRRAHGRHVPCQLLMTRAPLSTFRRSLLIYERSALFTWRYFMVHPRASMQLAEGEAGGQRPDYRSHFVRLPAPPFVNLANEMVSYPVHCHVEDAALRPMTRRATSNTASPETHVSKPTFCPKARQRPTPLRRCFLAMANCCGQYSCHSDFLPPPRSV